MDLEARGPRSTTGLVLLLGLALLAGAGFFSLGLWQVHRLAWKEALIARVARNVNAVPRPAPGPAEWARIPPDD
jgi:surfeit locus 1 family protein